MTASEGQVHRTGHVNPNGAVTVARPLFVGRRSELERLQASFEGAASGQSGLVMLVGEPGIGKTTLC